MGGRNVGVIINLIWIKHAEFCYGLWFMYVCVLKENEIRLVLLMININYEIT